MALILFAAAFLLFEHNRIKFWTALLTYIPLSWSWLFELPRALRGMGNDSKASDVLSSKF
jgi:hypothetical protein